MAVFNAGSQPHRQCDAESGNKIVMIRNNVVKITVHKAGNPAFR